MFYYSSCFYNFEHMCFLNIISLPKIHFPQGLKCSRSFFGSDLTHDFSYFTKFIESPISFRLLQWCSCRYVWDTPTKRQVSKRQVSKRLVSKCLVSKRQVYKTSGLHNVRFQNVWFQNVQFLNLIYLGNKKYWNCRVCIPI